VRLHMGLPWVVWVPPCRLQQGLQAVRTMHPGCQRSLYRMVTFNNGEKILQATAWSLHSLDSATQAAAVHICIP
jgi:hypothetical protein